MFDWIPASALMIALLLWWPTLNAILAAFAWRIPSTPTSADDDSGPTGFIIIIPALNEERVIETTVRNALSLATEKTPVQVVVVDDASDDRTPAILSTIADPRLHVLRRELPEARLGKGDALNAACTYILDQVNDPADLEHTVVGVIDGDGRGSVGMLTEIARILRDDTVGAVQCRVRIHNRDRLIPLLQDLEFGAVADSSQTLRDLVGSVGLGGNGQFVRLSVLARFAPLAWSDCLVEDLELGLRLHLANVRVRYTKTAWVSQQGLPDVRRLLRQRARWAQGNLQCLRHLRLLARSHSVSTIGLLDFMIYLLAPWVTVPLSLVVAGLVTTIMVGAAAGATMGGLVAGPAMIVIALATWLFLLFLPGLVWALVHRLRLGDEPLHRCLLAGLLYPGFLLCGVIATWRALFCMVRGRNSWTKTDRLIEHALEARNVPPSLPAGAGAGAGAGALDDS